MDQACELQKTMRSELEQDPDRGDILWVNLKGSAFHDQCVGKSVEGFEKGDNYPVSVFKGSQWLLG